MQPTTSAPLTVPVWPLSYKGRGFILANVDDEACQGIVQGGYHTAPCESTSHALELVKAYIDGLEAH